ncbi:MAG: hypothetical protein ABIT05_03675 [Chitinophagaceae bacterium]
MRFVCAILLILSINANSQKVKFRGNFDLPGLVKETAGIMTSLGIKIRENMEKDDTLKLDVTTKKEFFNAEFISHLVATPNKNSNQRYYILPIIMISPTLDSVLFNKVDTNAFTRLKAFETIVHEITHFLQITLEDNYFRPTDMKDFNKYASQLSEIEAYAVGGYYFLKYYNKKKLKTILKSKTSNLEKMKSLFKTLYETLYPWRPKIVFE